MSFKSSIECFDNSLKHLFSSSSSTLQNLRFFASSGHLFGCFLIEHEELLPRESIEPISLRTSIVTFFSSSYRSPIVGTTSSGFTEHRRTARQSVFPILAVSLRQLTSPFSLVFLPGCLMTRLNQAARLARPRLVAYLAPPVISRAIPPEQWPDNRQHSTPLSFHLHRILGT